MATPKFLLVGGCPAPYDIAPYIDFVTKRANRTPSSIYRGQNPAATPLLHRFGHHTQKELVEASPAQRAAWGVTGTPNSYGHSQHELFDDSGRPIPTWKQGVDAGPNTDENRRALTAAAAHYGWLIRFPYNSVVEYHHWQFAVKPKPNRRIPSARIAARRLALRVSTAKQMKGHW